MPAGADQKNSGRARVKIAVFFVIGVHVVVFAALLMQGCKKEEAAAPVEAQPMVDTNPPPVIDTNPPPVVPSNPPPVANIDHPVVPAGDATTYAVQKGDSFEKIGKKFHVSTKAIQDANPGVDPTKLQIKQKLNIPAAASAPSLAVVPGVDAIHAAVDSGVYSVKSGDTLGSIAQKNHTSVKAIRALNNLTTDKIKVTQKLKLPAGSAPAPEPVVPAPAAAPAPVAVPSLPPPTK